MRPAPALGEFSRGVLGWHREVLGWHRGVLGWHRGVLGWHRGVLGWHRGVLGWHRGFSGGIGGPRAASGAVGWRVLIVGRVVFDPRTRRGNTLEDQARFGRG